MGKSTEDEDVKKYKFFDTDSYGNMEFDISGQDYIQLLEICFKYSSTMSMLIDKRRLAGDSRLLELEKHRLPLTDTVKGVYGHYPFSDMDSFDAMSPYEIRHYSLNPHTRPVISSITCSLFTWMCGWEFMNPTDPAFYRNDGSVFFSSIIHEGECTIMPKESEDIGMVLKDHWKCC